MDYGDFSQGVNINGESFTQEVRETILDASSNTFTGDVIINGKLFVEEEVIHEITKLETTDPVVELNNQQTLGGANKDIGWTGKNTNGITINYKGAILKKDSDKLIVFNNANVDPNGSGLVAPYDLGSISVRDGVSGDEVVNVSQLNTVKVDVSNVEQQIDGKLNTNTPVATDRMTVNTSNSNNEYVSLQKDGSQFFRIMGNTGQVELQNTEAKGVYIGSTTNHFHFDNNNSNPKFLMLGDSYIAMNGNKIVDLSDATNSTDAVNLQTLETKIGEIDLDFLPTAGGTITGNLTVDGNYDSLTGDVITQHGDIEAVNGKVKCGSHFVVGGQIQMSGQNITGMGDPTLTTDGANKRYVDQKTADIFPSTGGTITGNVTVNGNYDSLTGDVITQHGDIEAVNGKVKCGSHFVVGGQIQMSGQKITGMGDPTLTTDGANRRYVDQKTADIFPTTGGSLTGDLSVVKETANINIISDSGSGSIQQRLNFYTHESARGGGLFWLDDSSGNRKSFFGKAYQGGSPINGIVLNMTTTGQDIENNADENVLAMRFNDDKNCGIGVNPTAKLDVGGDTRIRGNLTVNGSIIGGQGISYTGSSNETINENTDSYVNVSGVQLPAGGTYFCSGTLSSWSRNTSGVIEGLQVLTDFGNGTVVVNETVINPFYTGASGEMKVSHPISFKTNTITGTGDTDIVLRFKVHRRPQQTPYTTTVGYEWALQFVAV